MDSFVFFILGLIAVGFVLLCGLTYLIVLGLIYSFNCLNNQATQRRAAKAQNIVQHSVTVEVD
ncbi:MAG: hypothetical protein JO316_25415 [Abitibacteriaceae bacterium]|nr:hypothetical protein [Abditibacteriaceae bacterium]MBV9868710.1 hypothetical protein [Abditibacteriaceae bacterium]